MARVHHNLLQAVLDGDIDDNDTTITFTAPLREWGEDNIATITAPDVLAIRIGYELLHITAYTSGASSATVIRGQEGSTATAHAEGDAIRHVITDLDLPNLSSYAALAGATFTGDVIVPDEAYDATAWNGNLEVPTKNAVRDKIETIGSGTVSDAVYGAGWDGDTTVAPSKNAVYDKIETLGAGSVSDTAYAGSWDGVTTIAPSKNAVYDKIETLAPSAGAVGGPPLIKYKSADESLNTNTTLQDDDALFFAISASQTWAWEGTLFPTGPTAADIKIAFTCPSSPTSFRYGASGLFTDLSSMQNRSETASGTAIPYGTDPTTAYIINVFGTIENGANAGNIKLQWAQNASSGTDTFVRRGSVLRAWRIA